MSDYEKVTVEIDEWMVYQCANCGKTFSGTAVIYLDENGKTEGGQVWCVPCDSQSLATRTNPE